MRRAATLAMAMLVLGTTGCFRHSVSDSRHRGSELVTNEWVPYVIVGLVPIGAHPIEAGCSGGLARVEIEQTFLNGLVAYFTSSIFTPLSISYSCVGATRRQQPGKKAPAEQPTEESIPVL